MYLLYFDHNDNSYSRKWMRKINFFTPAILRTLRPYPGDFAFHFYLHFTIIYACYDALMPIKLFDYSQGCGVGVWSRWSRMFSPGVGVGSRSRFSKLLESELGVGVGFLKLVESESGVGSRSRFFKTAGVRVRSRSRNICCNYRLQCLLNNLNYNINCLKIITGYWQY